MSAPAPRHLLPSASKDHKGWCRPDYCTNGPYYRHHFYKRRGVAEAVLNDPQRITHEYRRRLTDLASESQPNTDVGEVERRISTLRRGVGRLIDGYTDGVIERVEFEPRVADLRARIAQLEEHRDALAAASAAQRDLTLVIGRLEDFSIRVRENLDLLDWSARRDVIRLMVRRIEIDDSQVEIVFRIPPPPSGGTGGDRKLKAAQHCTGERRTHHSLAEPLPSTGQGLGEPQLQGARLPPPCLDPPHAAKALQSRIMFPDRLLGTEGETKGDHGWWDLLVGYTRSHPPFPFPARDFSPSTPGPTRTPSGWTSLI